MDYANPVFEGRPSGLLGAKHRVSLTRAAWREERLDAIRFTRPRNARLWALSDFQDYRKPQTVIVKANLRNWRPVT